MALLVAAGAAWFLRSPRLTHSFTNDEEMAFRKYVWGEVQVQPDGSLQHSPIGWGRPCLKMRRPTTKWAPLSKLGLHGALQPTRGRFTCRSSRLSRICCKDLSLLSAALSVMAVGWLGWLLGAPRVGLAAALLLALSPWHFRYSVEIRGYSTMLLMRRGGALGPPRALETGRWRWWLAFAAAQAWYLLC